MPPSSSAQEKTEPATPKKLLDARNKGQVPKSADFNAAMCLVVGVAYVYVMREDLGYGVQELLNYYFHNYITSPPTPEVAVELLFAMTIAGFALLLPLFITLVLIAIVANIIQFGFLFAPKAIEPKFSKLDPIQGTKRMFSARTLFELFKSVLKVAVIGIVVFLVARGQYGPMLKLFYGPPVYIFHQVVEALLIVLFWGGVTYLFIAILDLIFQRYDFLKNQRMTIQEVKDELKQSEGDPQIKAWLKRRQRDLLMNTIKEEVPKATVVVTNPTHYAVALKYNTDSALQANADMVAPVVVAKGADLMAQKIKEIARQHNVPVQENKEIAQFLYHNIEIGQEVPPELYHAVAEILATVYRLNER